MTDLRTGKSKPATCTRCGVPVLTFSVNTQSWPVQLEDHELSVTADLTALTSDGLVWRDLGPRIGWDPLIVAVRDWRPLRAAHRCASNQENKTEEKHA